VHPVAISRQNTRSVSRLNDGFPGDFITGLPVNAFIQPAGLPIITSGIEVLRRPVESVQYTSIRYTDTLALEGLQPTIGSVGNAYDNAAAGTVMGLFKNEAVAKDSPFRTGALKTETDVMEIVFDWVHWYNNERLHTALDHQMPEEFEQRYYDLQTDQLPADAANKNRRHDSWDGSALLSMEAIPWAAASLATMHRNSLLRCRRVQVVRATL
jgi:hypothetical protein